VDEAFCQQLAAALAEGPVAVATVAQVQGSVPREVGASLAIAAHGRCWGTVGGGAGEARAIAAAREVLASGAKQQLELDLSGRSWSAVGVCGGWLQVWIERWSGPPAIALATFLHRQLAAGQSVRLAMQAGPGLPQPLQPEEPASETAAWILDLQPAPTLLVVGAGHVAAPLVALAAAVGFRVVVQDERPDWAEAARFPQAVRVIAGPVAAAIASLAPVADLYAALVTRGVEYDQAALQLLLRRSPPCRYLGAIGSRQRVQVVKQALVAGGLPADRLASLRAPIGLDIGALTPAEIAVSIAAELIQVRRGGSGQPLSQRAPA